MLNFFKNYIIIYIYCKINIEINSKNKNVTGSSFLSIVMVRT